MAFKDVIKPSVFKLSLVCLMLVGVIVYLYNRVMGVLRQSMAAEQVIVSNEGGVGAITNIVHSPSPMITLLNIGYLVGLIIVFYIIALIIEQAYLKIFKE